jgi:hypothetical protein
MADTALTALTLVVALSLVVERTLEFLKHMLAEATTAPPLAATVIANMLVAGCQVALVQPYDEKLFNDTEAFYKKAAGIINEGIEASPRTDGERKAIKEPVKSPAHFTNFAPKYDALLDGADLLIMRGLAGSGKLDASGERINKKVEDVIAKNVELPAVCKDLDEQFKQAASLTVKNYVDLKCLVVGWRAQHADGVFTENTLILKQANWEGRRQNLFNAVLAIQKAEAFKKDK